ncbi:MAG: LuxR C-terminal-related transcriptional regulator [Actinomycetota bacterium]
MRPGVVERSALLGRLLNARRARVVAIVAPSGYGKTTLMAQWRQRERRPVAWLSADRDDNDPATLLFHLAAALRSAGMLAGGTWPEVGLGPDLPARYGVAGLAGALDGVPPGGVLLLDHAESIRSRVSNDIVAELARSLPAGMQLAVASRTGMRLPAATLRAQGALLEISASDLALDRAEAEALLDGMGVDAGAADLDELMRRTEGWPVGLYLAGLAAQSVPSRISVRQISGTDRYVADYLRHEMLDHFSGASVAFLTRTSVLERFNGPLCDAVLAGAGSGRAIERFEKSNLLIVPLDRDREWYRYHPLLRDVLRAELLRREPGIVPTLHVRAAEWFEESGMPEPAVAHAQAAGDADRVARIVGRAAHAMYARGRAGTVLGWLRWFEQQADGIARYPSIAALGALVHALTGDERGADRWAAFMSTGVDAGTETVPVSGRLVRAILARGGTGQIRADAEAVRRAYPADKEWLPAALTVEGFAHLWDGNDDAADVLLAQAVATGEWFPGLPAATLALGGRALIAISRGHWHAANQLVDQSLVAVRENGLHGYLTSALTYAVATRCAVRRGDAGTARRLLARAAAIRPLLAAATPGLSVQTLLEIARAHRELSDISEMRTVLLEASDILARRPDLGSLRRQYSEIKHRLDTTAPAVVGNCALSAAELRLLPWLARYLSFPEIGERLHLSRHTVKTQAMSIYRKLHASSRSEAVRHAIETGLLEA